MSTPFLPPRPDQPSRRISDRLQDLKRWQWKAIAGLMAAYIFWQHQQLISQFANAANADAAWKAVGSLSERVADVEGEARVRNQQQAEQQARVDTALLTFGAKLDRFSDVTTALTIQMSRLNDRADAERRGAKP